MPFGPQEACALGVLLSWSLGQECRRVSCLSQQPQLAASDPVKPNIPDRWVFALKNLAETCGVLRYFITGCKCCNCRGGDW